MPREKYIFVHRNESSWRLRLVVCPKPKPSPKRISVLNSGTTEGFTTKFIHFQIDIRQNDTREVLIVRYYSIRFIVDGSTWAHHRHYHLFFIHPLTDLL